MRFCYLLWCPLLCVACTDSTAGLRLTIVVEDRLVHVHAREMDRPCTCSAGELPALGTCERQSDAVSCTCDPPPADCLSDVWLTRDGAVVADSRFYGVGYAQLQVADALTSDATLAVRGCGGEARVSIAAGTPPEPMIVSALDDGSRVSVVWSADASASALVSLHNSDAGTVCHAGSSPVLFDSPRGSADHLVIVRTLSQAAEVSTDLGVARVHYGARAAEALP